jgi:hypothetical protein
VDVRKLRLDVKPAAVKIKLRENVAPCAAARVPLSCHQKIKIMSMGYATKPQIFLHFLLARPLRNILIRAKSNDYLINYNNH